MRLLIFQEIYPGRFSPSPCHKFIRRIEERGCLLRNYTQNIDTLEQVAGLQKVIQCHGVFTYKTVHQLGIFIYIFIIQIYRKVMQIFTNILWYLQVLLLKHLAVCVSWKLIVKLLRKTL